MLEPGLYECYVIDVSWTDSAEVALTIEMAVIAGPHKGEMISINVPAGTRDGGASDDLASVCAHFALATPTGVPDTYLELALMGMPCTLVTDGKQVRFEGAGSYADPNIPPDQGDAAHD